MDSGKIFIVRSNDYTMVVTHQCTSEQAAPLIVNIPKYNFLQVEVSTINGMPYLGFQPGPSEYQTAESEAKRVVCELGDLSKWPIFQRDLDGIQTKLEANSEEWHEAMVHFNKVFEFLNTCDRTDFSEQ